MNNVTRIIFYCFSMAAVAAMYFDKSVKPWQYLFCFAVLEGISVLENKLDDLMKQAKKPEEK